MYIFPSFRRRRRSSSSVAHNILLLLLLLFIVDDIYIFSIPLLLLLLLPRSVGRFVVSISTHTAMPRTPQCSVVRSPMKKLAANTQQKIHTRKIGISLLSSFLCVGCAIAAAIYAVCCSPTLLYTELSGRVLMLPHIEQSDDERRGKNVRERKFSSTSRTMCRAVCSVGWDIAAKREK